MQVILTAFGAKLKSQPMDWPENTGPRIRLMLDMDRSQWFNDRGKLDAPPEQPRPVIGVFEADNTFHWTEDGNTARHYHLIGLE